MEPITFQLNETKSNISFPDDLGFGKIFTNHIFMMDYNEGKGWHNPIIKPLEDLPIHPATMFIHYGQAIFEGMKAYKTANDEVIIFRPDQYFKRMNNSARRMCIP